MKCGRECKNQSTYGLIMHRICLFIILLLTYQLPTEMFSYGIHARLIETITIKNSDPLEILTLI